MTCLHSSVGLRRLPPTYALVYACLACGQPVQQEQANMTTDLDKARDNLRGLRDDAQQRGMPLLAGMYQEKVLQNWKARLIASLRGGKDNPCSTDSK